MRGAVRKQSYHLLVAFLRKQQVGIGRAQIHIVRRQFERRSKVLLRGFLVSESPSHFRELTKHPRINLALSLMQRRQLRHAGIALLQIAAETFNSCKASKSDHLVGGTYQRLARLARLTEMTLHLQQRGLGEPCLT